MDSVADEKGIFDEALATAEEELRRKEHPEYWLRGRRAKIVARKRIAEHYRKKCFLNFTIN